MALVGYGQVGSGQRAGSGNRRYPWRWSSQDLGINGSGLSLEPIEFSERRDILNGEIKRLRRKKALDPRAVRYHDITINFKAVNHEIVQLIEEDYYFLNEGFTFKFYQFDSPDTNVGTPYADASRLKPATQISSSCATWFLLRRWISNDSGDGPKLYVNETLQSSGFTWNYTEGAVTFNSVLNITDVVRAYYVWKPKLVVTRYQPGPYTGKYHNQNVYDITVTFQEK